MTWHFWNWRVASYVQRSISLRLVGISNQGYLKRVLKRSLVMTSRARSYMKLAMAGLLVLSLLVVGVDAQKKKKRSRRTRKPAAAKPVITNPDIAPPTTTDANGDVKIISTADQTEAEAASETAQPKKPKSSPSPDDMQQTITTLSNQVNKLNNKLSEMQEIRS